MTAEQKKQLYSDIKKKGYNNRSLARAMGKHDEYIHAISTRNKDVKVSQIKEIYDFIGLKNEWSKLF